MDWLQKVRYLKDIERGGNYDNSEYHVYAFFGQSVWGIGELESIIIDYPWLPQDYIGFIKEFSKVSLAFVSFFSSQEKKNSMLIEEINELKPFLGIDYFPFGKDADGSIFVFNKQQEVWRVDIEAYEVFLAHTVEGGEEGFSAFDERQIVLFERYCSNAELPSKIADTFEEFVGECLMGKRYHEFTDIEQDTYYDLLKHLGWA